MNSDPAIYTVTMAKVYASQGHFGQAVSIYRRLLEKEPDRTDLVAALAGAEQQLAEQKKIRKQDLELRFSEWLELLHKYSFLRKLNRLKGEWSGHGE
jgi:lipopolysaccharide biosynthesis regulator YciM